MNLINIKNYYKEQIAYFWTYENKLKRFNSLNKKFIKLFSSSFNKNLLRKHIEIDITSKYNNDSKQLLKKLDNFPNIIKCTFYLIENIPRALYLKFYNLPEDESENSKDYRNLKLHNITVLTANNWIFINNFVKEELNKNNLKILHPRYFNISRGNILTLLPDKERAESKKSAKFDFKAIDKIGEDYIKWTCDPELEWVIKNKKLLFKGENGNKLYNMFVENYIKTNTNDKNYDNFYLTALQIADLKATTGYFVQGSREYFKFLNKLWVKFKEAKTTDIPENILNI